MAKHRTCMIVLLLAFSTILFALPAAAVNIIQNEYIVVNVISLEGLDKIVYDTPPPLWSPIVLNNTFSVTVATSNLTNVVYDANVTAVNVTTAPWLIFSAPDTVYTNIPSINVSICAVEYGDGPASNVKITAMLGWNGNRTVTTGPDGCAYLPVSLPETGEYVVTWVYDNRIVATTKIIYVSGGQQPPTPPSNETPVKIVPGLPPTVPTPVTPVIGVPVSVPALAFIALGLAALVVAVMQGGADLGEAILIASVPYGIAVILLGFREAGLTMVAAGILAYIFLRR